MTVPQKLVGAWRRSGLLLDGKRHVDYSDVLWLQTPEWYADIRLPINPGSIPPATGAPWFYAEMASAGKADWNEPSFTWNQAIQIPATSASITNQLTWVNGVAAETGETEAGGAIKVFTEEWLRITGDDVRWSAEANGNHVWIEIADFAVEISDGRDSGGRFSAIRYQKAGAEWVPFGTVTAP